MFVCVVSLSMYMLYVKCFCLLSRYLSPSSREWHLLYVKCLCLLSRYLIPVVENGICYMLNVYV